VLLQGKKEKGQGKSTEGSSLVGRFLLPFTLCLLPFVLLCTLNSAGYRYGASDLAFYIPAALEKIDPALFPRDGALIGSQARLTMIDETIGLLARMTGLGLPSLFASLYATTLALLLAGTLILGRMLYRGAWTTLALVAAVTLRHAIAKSGTNTLEGYFHPRQLAFSLGVLAVVALMRRRMLVSVALVLAGGLLHPTTALWFAIWIAVAWSVNEPQWRGRVAILAGLAALVGAWTLIAGPLAGRLVQMDPEWLATLETKDYLFPLEWPAYVWLLNLVYAPTIVLIYRRRRDAGLLAPGERGVVWGCLSLLAVFALALPLNAARFAIVIQLQIPRVFWMLDFLAITYLVWIIAEDVRGSLRRARITFLIIALASLTRCGYIKFIKFPDRPIAEISVPDNDWGRVMAWARSTPRDSGWLAHPGHAVQYGTSLRVAGQRDVFVEGIKDAAIGMYDRDVAMRTRDRLAELEDFDTLTPERARSLAERYRLNFLVTTQQLDLPVAYSSGPLFVYRLR
jgi:hypothetical protein